MCETLGLDTQALIKVVAVRRVIIRKTLGRTHSNPERDSKAKRPFSHSATHSLPLDIRLTAEGYYPLVLH